MDDREEASALLVGFFTQSLNEKPNGLTLPEFERIFPERTDEPRDWYKRYGYNNTIEALSDCKAVRISQDNRNNCVLLSLNRHSDKVDQHLASLVINQKSKSSKRRKPPGRAIYRPHYQKVQDSFALNRYSSSAHRAPTDRIRSRLNHDQAIKSSSPFLRRPKSPPSFPEPPRQHRLSSYNDSSRNAAPGDPRSRQSTMVPPQVRPPPQMPPQGATQVKQPAYQQSSLSSRYSSSRRESTTLTPSSSRQEQRTRGDENNPVKSSYLENKKSVLKNRLMQMLYTNYDEIKILFLASLYKQEFHEEIDPTELGYKSITALIEDPFFNDEIKINFKCPHVTVSARNIDRSIGKENVAASTGNRSNNNTQGAIGTNGQSTADKTNVLTARQKFNAIDPFNVRTMLQSLEPLHGIRESPLGNSEIEDTVKFRTLRIIYRNPDMTLKLNDWERRYQQEWNCYNKIQIRDYGFRSLVDFFKKLATELPIEIMHNNEEWVAKLTSFEALSDWIKKKMQTGCYRAVTVIDAKYEQVVFPFTHYKYRDLTDLALKDFHPTMVLSVRGPTKMWIQVRTQKRLEDHLSIETSMNSYNDYKRKGFFKVPESFLKPGFPCVAYDETLQRWCRALVMKAPELIVHDSVITALLVDYGVTKTFLQAQLLCILQHHFKQPVSPLLAELHGVNEGREPIAGMVLQEYTCPPVTLACKVKAMEELSEVDGVDKYLPANSYVVDLIDTRQGRDLNLADLINATSS